MVDEERLAKYIRELENYLGQLNELKKISKEDYISDWRVSYIVERTLHLSLETFLSIGEMIISELRFKKPDSYAEIPKILTENKVIPQQLAEKLIDLAKFRNVLVHEYLYLDREKVYQHLFNDQEIIQEFLNCIKQFIKNINKC